MAETRDTYRRRNPWLTLVEKGGLYVLFETQDASGKFNPLAFETMGDFIVWTKTAAPVGTFIPFQPGDVFEVVPPVERVVKRTPFAVPNEPEPAMVGGTITIGGDFIPDDAADAPLDDDGPEPPTDLNAEEPFPE